MCVHVYAATSSPGCCNYALGKTAVDNASDFKVGVVETLMINFDIDDLLKSVESENSTIQLIQDVRKICQRDGLDLTKFNSKRKGVLKSVSEDHRRDGVKK